MGVFEIKVKAARGGYEAAPQKQLGQEDGARISISGGQGRFTTERVAVLDRYPARGSPGKLRLRAPDLAKTRPASRSIGPLHRRLGTDSLDPALARRSADWSASSLPRDQRPRKRPSPGLSVAGGDSLGCGLSDRGLRRLDARRVRRGCPRVRYDHLSVRLRRAGTPRTSRRKPNICPCGPLTASVYYSRHTGATRMETH